MGIFTNFSEGSELSDRQLSNLVESFLIDDLSRLNEAQIAEFCAPGGVGEALVEAKVLGKRTMVRLSRTDDLERRITMTSMQLARDMKDPLFDKLALNRVKEKQLLAAIRKKYGMKAEKEAKVAQKEYIKTMKKVPASFMKFGGADRV